MRFYILQIVIVHLTYPAKFYRSGYPAPESIPKSSPLRWEIMLSGKETYLIIQKINTHGVHTYHLVRQLYIRSGRVQQVPHSTNIRIYVIYIVRNIFHELCCLIVDNQPILRGQRTGLEECVS